MSEYSKGVSFTSVILLLIFSSISSAATLSLAKITIRKITPVDITGLNNRKDQTISMGAASGVLSRRLGGFEVILPADPNSAPYNQFIQRTDNSVWKLDFIDDEAFPPIAVDVTYEFTDQYNRADFMSSDLDPSSKVAVSADSFTTGTRLRKNGSVRQITGGANFDFDIMEVSASGPHRSTLRITVNVL